MATFRKFYIGSRQIQIELSPQLANTLDETLDNLTVNEIANEIANPYTPFQRFYVKDENDNIIQTFIISNDNVELSTLNPARYIHHLSLVQESEFLTKHEIRNTVFSNEQDNNITKYISASVYASEMKDVNEPGQLLQGLYYGENVFSYFSDKVNAQVDLSKKSVYKMSLKIRFNYQAIMSHGAGSGAHSINMEYRAPTKWSDIYADALIQANIQYYPTIRFTIGNEYRDLQLRNDTYNNNDIVDIPDDIIEWIQGFDSGILQITIEDAQFQDTYMYSNIFDNQRVQQGNPWFVNISYIFDISLGSIDYNIYSVIDTLLKQQMKESTAYNSTNDSANIKPLFLLPTASHNSDLYNLLKETQVPNLIFTQCSMYDILAEIFKLFDAIFTIDNDGYLDIEYFNEQAQTPITEPEKAGVNRSLSEERFTDRLITYFQNTKINDKFPNTNDETSLAYLRSKTLGVPGESDYVFVVPKPIDLIKSVKVKAPIKFSTTLQIRYSGTVHNLHFGDPTEVEPLDITPFVIEESIWSILPNGEPPIDGNWGTQGKFNCLNYKRGNNYIDVSGYQTDVLNKKNQTLSYLLQSAINCLMGIGSSQTVTLVQTTSINWRDVQMSVEYIALVDGKLVNESLTKKYSGETLINQSNGSIDINKLGLNMVGLGLKLGQPTLNMTQVITSWDNRVKKGQYFTDSGGRWVANNCVYTVIKPDLVQANIEFVRDFNGLAKRIELNSEKRLSNISNELTTKCEETYGEFMYYSSMTEDLWSEDKEDIVIKPDYLLIALANTFSNKTPYSNTRIEYAVLTPYDKDNNIISVTGLGNLSRVAVPLMVYGSGNSVCFEMSYESPISAGNQLLDNYTSNLWSGGWFSRAVLYTAEDGTFDNCNIEFVKLDASLNRNFPLMSGLSMTTLGMLEHFKYYKKPNEIFALNYQLHFMPYNKNRDFLSNEFIKNNGFANGLNRKKLFITFSTQSRVYSILDTKGEGTTTVPVDSVNISSDSSGNASRFQIRFNCTLDSGVWNTINSWAIVDKDNNIYFATNSAPREDFDTSTNQFSIYFMSRHHRLD